MKSLSRFLLYLILVLVALAGSIFTLKNLSPVNVWLFADFQALPLAIWILGAFISGGLLGLSLGFGIWRKLQNRVRLIHLQKELQQRDSEVQDLQKQLKSLKKDKENRAL